MTTYSPGLGSSGGGGGATEVQLKNVAGNLVNPATSDNQDAMIVLQTEINSLTETIQELNARLMVLAGMANSGAPALRVAPISSVSTAVTGSVTATVASTVVSSLTTFGTIPAYTVAWSQQNLLATQANVNNATA